MRLPGACDQACKAQFLACMQPRTLTSDLLRVPVRHARAEPAAAMADNAADAAQHDSSGALTLKSVRSSLIRQEDTIIFNIIERAQFARNDAVYTSEGVPVPAYDLAGNKFTFLEYLLRDTERVHGRIRRYTSPDEHAFFPAALPPMVCPLLMLYALLRGHLLCSVPVFLYS
jgi:hypothetical protein